MAKNKENKNVETTMTVENVVEVINKGNRADALITEKVLDKIQAEKDERKISEIKERINQADFDEARELLHLRQRRREDDITLEALTRYGDLKLAMIGFTIDDTYLAHHKIKGDEVELETPNEKGELVKKKFKKGDYIAPYVDYVDYDTKREEIRRDIRKKMNESDAQYDAEYKKLQAAFGSYWNPRW